MEECLFTSLVDGHKAIFSDDESARFFDFYCEYCDWFEKRYGREPEQDKDFTTEWVDFEPKFKRWG